MQTAAYIEAMCDIQHIICLLQVATKAGVLNVPEWYEAGSVWVKNNPGFPFGECQTSRQHGRAQTMCKQAQGNEWQQMLMSGMRFAQWWTAWW